MKDKLFNKGLLAISFVILLIAAGMIYSLVNGSLSAFKEFGLGFIFSNEWDPHPERESYGAFPFIIGTLLTSFLALAISLPFSLSIALFTGEYFKNKKFANIISSVVELLSGIPSIVFGLWGFYTIKPLLVDWGISQNGLGVLTASIVLAIMIIPFASSLSREFISMVSNDVKEASYSLGSTRYEMISKILLPTANSGILASFVLALGRAIGETMAVTMLIGNVNQIPLSLTDSANTMASVIANQFGEASGLKLSSLIAIALLLFLITAIINFIGKMIIKKYNS